MRNRPDIITLLLTMLLAAASLSSCRKVTIPPTAGDAVISFGSSVDTKSLVEDVTDMEGFLVYGYYTVDGSTSHTAFDGVTVTRSGALWTYSPARYWISDAGYSFAAFHPSDAQVTITHPEMDADGVFTGLSFEYEKTGFQDDFMLSTKSMKTEDAAENGYTVQLPFEHLLANLNVKIGFAAGVQDGTYIRLTGVVLNGMKRSATYTVGQGWSDLSSTALQFSGNIDILMHKQGGKIYSNGTELPDGTITPTGEDGLTVIPIDLTDPDNRITLRLNCEISNDGVNFASKIIEKTFVATAGIDEWKQSKTYTYTALLDVDYSISFSEPTVTDWVDEQATGSVIIK